MDPRAISMDQQWELRLLWQCRQTKRPRYASNKMCALKYLKVFIIMHMCFVDQFGTHRDDIFQLANAIVEGVMVVNLTLNQTWDELCRPLT